MSHTPAHHRIVVVAEQTIRQAQITRLRAERDQLKAELSRLQAARDRSLAGFELAVTTADQALELLKTTTTALEQTTWLADAAADDLAGVLREQEIEPPHILTLLQQHSAWCRRQFGLRPYQDAPAEFLGMATQ